MNILTWNTRGLNHPIKQKEVRNHIQSFPLDIVCLLETKVREHNLVKTCNAINPSFASFDNHSSNMAARILLLWNPNTIKIQILSHSDQAIFCHITYLNLTLSYFTTFVYASNDRKLREQLWSSLRQFQLTIGDAQPWLILGDFNVVLHESEKKGGINVDKGATSEFKECLEELEVMDLRYSGCQFTWNNKQQDGFRIFSKLDRALVNEAWLTILPNSEAYFPAPTISDHSPAIVNLRLDASSGKKPFKFFNYWTQHSAFSRLVEEEWLNAPLRGSPLSNLFTKLKSFKNVLKEFNSKHYGALPKRVAEAKHKLEEIQKELMNNPRPELIEEESQAIESFMQLSFAEEAFYKQKARDNSIRLGEQNTSYFHRKVKAHCSRNKIVSILNNEGERIEDYKDVKAVFIEFYQKLLGSSVDYPSNAKAYVEELMQTELPINLLQPLGEEVSDEEIKSTLFSLPSHKAPGPDGYTSHFFKETWSQLGEEVTCAIKSFFVSSKLPRVANSTIIALVPKVPNPSMVKDYRPISCCSTIYKCISKIIANRLKVILPYVISPMQAAFVKGRTISDQVLLMQELVRNYHRKNMSPRCALKIDLMKAFDSVSWDLLLDILKALKLPSPYIGWIKECITTPQFSISLNGALEGYFPGAKGLRQGDPLSPYLFLLAMEFFSRLLNNVIKEGEFSFHPQCNNPSITHICFADDLFLLCKPTQATFQTIRRVLHEFHKYSGLHPNGSKSKVYISGLEDHEKSHLCTILGFQLGDLPVKYLGVPLITTKLKYEDCRELIEKTTLKVKNWVSKSLSYAGRLVLVKAVLFSVQVYWSIHFILPKKVIEAIEQILRRFLWRGAELKQGGCKVAWKDVCQPKREGGLGIRSLQDWNKASMLRHLWALCINKPSLWVQWCQANLIKGRCFWSLNTPSDCSWTWRKILKLREEAIKLSKYKVGNGESISLWYSNWHPNGPLIPRYGARVAYDAGLSKNARVSKIIANDQWKWPFPNTWELREIEAQLPSTYHPSSNQEDKLQWLVSKNLEYNSSATWEAIRPKAPKVQWFSLLWFSKHILRHSFIVWLAIKGRLTTKDKLEAWGMNIDPSCALCGLHKEDLDHLFFKCSFSAKVRITIFHLCSLSKPVLPWKDEVQWIVGKLSNKGMDNTIRKIAWSAMIYHLWQERNARIFKGTKASAEEVIKAIRRDVHTRISQFQVTRSIDNSLLISRWGLDCN